MQLPQRRILVVDDDHMVLRFLHSALATHFDVTTTNNPGAVPKIIEVERPALVLCDLHMPGGLSGAELAAQLQKDPATRDVPVVFLTSAVDQQPLERYGSQIGGRPAISKSAEVVELIAFLERVLAQAERRAHTEAGISLPPLEPAPFVFVQQEGYARIQ